RISKGWPKPRKMAARPVVAICQQGKPCAKAYAGGRLMQADQLVRGEFGVEALDHTAIAVRDIHAALPLYRDLLGGVPSGFERISQKGFMWMTLRYPNGSQVELLASVGDGGFLHDFLARRGEGVHHMTFIVHDLHMAVERARAAGLLVIDEDYTEPRWQEAFIS